MVSSLPRRLCVFRHGGKQQVRCWRGGVLFWRRQLRVAVALGRAFVSIKIVSPQKKTDRVERQRALPLSNKPGQEHHEYVLVIARQRQRRT